MADDGGLTDFLNTEKEVDAGGKTYNIVDVSNPVEWGKLGKTIGASIIVGISLGIQGIWNNWASGVIDIIEGGISFVGGVQNGGFLIGPGFINTVLSNPEQAFGAPPGAYGTGLIGAVVVPLLQFYQNGIWGNSIDTFGLFGLPVAMAITMTLIYIGIIGLQKAAQQLGGA